MTSLDDLPIRDDLRGQHPYGAPQLDVRYALNTNENTHSVPDDVAQDIVSSLAEVVRGLNRYPDREFTALRKALAGYVGHGLTAEHLWAANGSNEILQQILQAFGGSGRSVLGFPPTYSMHPIIAAGTYTDWVTAERDGDYTLSSTTVVAAIARLRPDIVFLCAPNNPTGTGVPLETIAAAYDAHPGILVVDEAYAEFMPRSAPSAVTLLPGRDRLIVSRTMSKAFAFAGARVGYLAAHPAVIDALRLVRLPYHLSSLTQAAAIAALRHADELLATVADIAIQRDRLATALARLGYRVFPSQANFLLVEGFASPQVTWQKLLERGILVRDVGIPGSLRITAGSAEETTAVIETLTALGPAERSDGRAAARG